MFAQAYEIPGFAFVHIKHGDSCPLNHQIIRHSPVYIDQNSIPLCLAQYLDDVHGTDEIVQNRRKAIITAEKIANVNEEFINIFFGGSTGDGLRMSKSDNDAMYVMMSVVVTYVDQVHLLPRDSANKTILFMVGDDCRPGYSNLEIHKVGDMMGRVIAFRKAIVPVGESQFLSSDLYRQGNVDHFSRTNGVKWVSNGPCSSVFSLSSIGDVDIVHAFPCVCWPREANEWKHRPRLNGWPSQTTIDKIVQGGCHLVPVGDKCSADTLLQWRISFVRAERLLVHSLTRPQFRVYGLLKYFLSNIKDLLGYIIGDSDILCSYFIKTAIFYAVENSPHSLWNEQNTFTCFRFCLSIIIAWVKSGYCPNYFIQTNNMFLRKVHGKNRHKLLHFLIDLYYLNWMCLIVESRDDPYIGRMLMEQPNVTSTLHSEYLRDSDLFWQCFSVLCVSNNRKTLHPVMKRLLVSNTEVDEIIAYYAMNTLLCRKACGFFEEYTTAGGNKQKYLALKKCEQLLVLQTEMCTSPGLLWLATFYYLTGNYKKTIEICSELMSTSKLFVGISSTSEKSIDQYKRLCCGRGYTLKQKIKNGIYWCFLLTKFDTALCLPQLMLEAKNQPFGLFIPPQPYAKFLSFMCYHELGDKRRRDTELLNLQALNYDPDQGGKDYWIVHTLLGICYQTVRDNRRAIRSFTDSLRAMPTHNPALERIDALRNSQQI